ncbi:MAG: hypothetical protein HY062_12795 [Bacteroidetes bacterium]|nr:hypothetical protein [Bacteroidota bacterium]
MKLLSAVLFFVACFTSVYSQDTIRFINKTVLVVKVQEIGINEIKYNKADNLSGPLYISDKREIEYIKFANGQVDSITLKKVQPLAPDFVVSNATPISSDEKLVIDGKKISQHGKPVGESRLLRLINNVPNQEKKAALNKDYLVMKSYKKKQYLFGFVGLGVGLALPYIGLMSAFILEDATPIFIGVAGGLTLGITGAVISSVNKNKRAKKRIEIANLYNN